MTTIFDNWQYHSFKKGTRFYGINLEQDLFEDWVITLINGSLITAMKRQRFIAYDTYESALSAFKKLVHHRLHKRRYKEVKT